MKVLSICIIIASICFSFTSQKEQGDYKIIDLKTSNTDKEGETALIMNLTKPFKLNVSDKHITFFNKEGEVIEKHEYSVIEGRYYLKKSGIPFTLEKGKSYYKLKITEYTYLLDKM